MKNYDFCYMSPWCEENRCCCESYDKDMALLSSSEPTMEALQEIEESEEPDDDLDDLLAEEIEDEDLTEVPWRFD